VMRCLEKLPADRFTSAEELAERLESFVRARTSDHSPAIVVRTLVAAGLAEGDPGTDRWLVEEKRVPIGGTMLGFGVILAVFALAGTWLQWNARDEREAAQAGSKRLELAPPNAGALRVVATPWAEVNVDGQRIDVTPMARAIPLAAGTHYVTLTHPSATPDKRVVVITAGETTTLEATMKLPTPGDKDAGAGAARVEDGGS